MLKDETAARDGSVDAPDGAASLARAYRELEATQARIQTGAERVYDETRRGLVVQLLPVLDNLDRTIDAAEKASDGALVDGVRIVRAELETVLFGYGVERIDAAGQRFDPRLHEAVAAVPVTDPKLVGAVMQQAASGYRLGAQILRAAKVSVGVQSSTVQSGRLRTLGPRW